jgi:hypothetical protein
MADDILGPYRDGPSTADILANYTAAQYPYGRPRFPNLDPRAYFDPGTNQTFRDEPTGARAKEAFTASIPGLLAGIRPGGYGYGPSPTVEYMGNVGRQVANAKTYPGAENLSPSELRLAAQRGDLDNPAREPNLGWQASPIVEDPGPPSRYIPAVSDADRAAFTQAKDYAGVNYEPEAAINPGRLSHQGTGQIAILDPAAARIVAPGDELAAHEFRAYHGTNAPFREIDPSKFQSFEASGDLTGKGFYATLSRKDAEEIAKARVHALGGKPTVLDVAVDGRRIPIARDDAWENALQQWLAQKYPTKKANVLDDAVQRAIELSAQRAKKP